jgi:anti-sigma factor ChrR (cupin superfamily)
VDSYFGVLGIGLSSASGTPSLVSGAFAEESGKYLVGSCMTAEVKKEHNIKEDSSSVYLLDQCKLKLPLILSREVRSGC